MERLDKVQAGFREVGQGLGEVRITWMTLGKLCDFPVAKIYHAVFTIYLSIKIYIHGLKLINLNRRI